MAFGFYREDDSYLKRGFWWALRKFLVLVVVSKLLCCLQVFLVRKMDLIGACGGLINDGCESYDLLGS